MIRAIRTFLCIAILIAFVQPAVGAPKFRAITSPLPPFSINKGLHVRGISVDILAVLMTVSGEPMVPDDVKLMLWSHALRMTKAGPRTIMLNVPKTPAFEPLFKWVGPIEVSRFVIIGRRGGKDINSIADLSKHKVATIRDSMPEKSLFAHGVHKPSVTSAATHIIPLKKLDRRMIDFFAHGDKSTTYMMKMLGMKPERFKVVHEYDEMPLYYAFSKDTSDDFIQKLNANLRRLKAPNKNGKSSYDRILAKYLPQGVIQ